MATTMSLTEIEKKIKVKLKSLELISKDNKRIISRQKENELRKQQELFQTRLNEICDLKSVAQELLIEAEEKTDEEIEQWNGVYNEMTEKFDESIEEIANEMRKLKKIEEIRAREEETKAREEEERRAEARRMKSQMKNEDGVASSSGCKIKVKLPDLVITKFNGTHLDWFRFWNQFESEIDKANISPVSKFSYLKEFVSPSVRLIIDGLPFNSEGYVRAKNILATKYGKASEVANAHTQAIMSLPQINGTNPTKIHEFAEKLLSSVQALETMGKLSGINGYVRMTLDKLQGIRPDLVRTDDSWREWKFPQLVEALEKWTYRNPKPVPESKIPERSGNTKSFQMKQTKPMCVYCDNPEHRSANCPTVRTNSERKKVLSEKKLCFNCTGVKHRAADCRSNKTCLICKNKHHTSICDKRENNKKEMSELLCTNPNRNVVYPVAIVKVNGIKCRALLDTGSGSSYASERLIDMLNIKPLRRELKTIETLTNTSSRQLRVYSVKIEDVDERYSIKTELNVLERDVLLTLPNPKYDEMTQKYEHLRDITMNETETLPELSIHVILGASDYAKIKMERKPKLGKIGEPIAEQTKMGWVIISPGFDDEITNSLFAKTSVSDYEKLCNTDILGLEERDVTHEEYVYEKFKEQLVRKDEGSYETGLIWKEGEYSLGTNKAASLGRLNNVLRNLKRDPETYKAYNDVIDEQVENDVIETISTETETNKSYYMPHRPVIRKNAESTKLRIVYDASAKSETGFSLNDCLEKGPSLQNKLWDILIRTRFRPVILCGDIEKAFLQIRIKESDRNFLRFHWTDQTNTIKTYRFCRLVFGLIQSPFILEGTLKYHFTKYIDEYSHLIDKIKNDMYVDDLITGGESETEVANLKSQSIELFKKGGFNLHKWHSNEANLESRNKDTCAELNYAKQQLGTKINETKILGVTWDKASDTFMIEAPNFGNRVTKRTILQTLASIYDPLGFISPVLLNGKLIYRDICDLKIPWDRELPDNIKKQWSCWLKHFSSKVSLPRAIPIKNKRLSYIDIHLFSDASQHGVCAVAYAIVNQEGMMSQQLLTSKSRLAKRNQTIPRQELIAAHMLANLSKNINNSLFNFPVRNTYAWTDSIVVLYWLKSNREYNIFVRNRVNKILQKQLTWSYVPTKENPADIGSRGCEISKLSEKWWAGPPWLKNKSEWPKQPIIENSEEADAESKKIKEVLATTIENTYFYDFLFEKYPLTKSLRIISWINRFINNCRVNQPNIKGPITTEEYSLQLNLVIHREQRRYRETEKFQNLKEKLNLRETQDGILKCVGRIQGDYPIYLPTESVLSMKLVETAHIETIHGGVTLLMANIRTKYWIPNLRQLAKKVINRCNTCKHFRALPYPTPPQGLLPIDRTTQALPFQIIGTDFAGPFTCKTKNKSTTKVYLLLFTCSITRAIHLELLPDQTTRNFISALKRLIARRGKPTTIYSDNAKTFKAASKWLKKVMREEEVQKYLTKQEITWKFNLSRAPWWGGQFERMIGLVKQCLNKTTGKSNLSVSEFEEILLDIETVLNNRPLMYVEDDIQMPILSPNTLLYGQPLILPEEHLDDDTPDIKRRQRYINQCKDAAWKRWQREYLVSLRERHNMKNKVKKMKIEVGDVVLIKGEEKQRNKWNTGIVQKIFHGQDDVIRGVRIKTPKAVIERPIQYLYPLELHCDIFKDEVQQCKRPLDVNAKEFRPKRTAAKISEILTRDICNDEAAMENI